MQQLSHGKAAGIAQQIMKNYNGKDNEAGGHNLIRIVGHHGCHNQADRNNRNAGQYFHQLLGKAAEQFIDQKAQANGHCTMETNILTISTVTVVRSSRYVMAGVRKGASSVFTLVIPTERATSPLDR